MSRQDPQFKLRMTEELRDRIAEAAAANNRSMNAEILARLEASLTSTPEILTTDERIAAQRTIDKIEEVRNDVTQDMEDFRDWIRLMKEAFPTRKNWEEWMSWKAGQQTPTSHKSDEAK